jgi:hypothetical protein
VLFAEGCRSLRDSQVVQTWKESEEGREDERQAGSRSWEKGKSADQRKTEQEVMAAARGIVRGLINKTLCGEYEAADR